MKKICSLLLAMLAFCQLSYAQWAQIGTSPNYALTLPGKAIIGGTSTPASYLDIFGITEQLRLGYDATHYTSFTTSTAGNFNINPNGGHVGLGSVQAASSFYNALPITGGTTSYGFYNAGVIQPDATTAVRYNQTLASTQAASFTLGLLYHYYAGQGTFGAGSTVSNQFGFYASSSLIGAVSNFGFYGNVPAGSNRWNLYMNGTASSYFNGNVGIGTAVPVAALHVAGNRTHAAWGTTGAYFASGQNTLTDSTTAASTTVANNAVNSFGAATLAATNSAVTYTNSYSVYIAGPPVAGANATLTNTYALYSGSGTNYFAGNVGIGTNTPGAKVEIRDNSPNLLTLNRTTSGLNNSILFKNTDGQLYVGMNQNEGFAVGPNLNLDTSPFIYTTNAGFVGIGTTQPDQKLTVNGSIHTKEVKVNTSIPVPDYVFEPNYKMLNLAHLKTYLDANHHLPDMPAAADIEKNGLNLGEMNLKLLKKVEELTLYAIQQQGENTKLQKAEQTQQQQINQLKEQLSVLTKSRDKKHTNGHKR